MKYPTMDNETLIDHITNALGNPHFDLNATLQALNEKIQDMQGKGQNVGSLLTISNLLPELSEEAKKRY